MSEKYKLTTIKIGGQEWPQILFCDLPIMHADAIRDLNTQSATIARLEAENAELRKENGKHDV